MSKQVAALLTVVTALALALLGSAGAGAATVTSPSAQSGQTTATLNPGVTVSYTGHAGDNTVADPALCLPQSADSMDLTCGHLGLGANASGPVTATVRFPADQELDLFVCRPMLVDTSPDQCTGGDAVALTSQNQTTTPDAAFTLTETITFNTGAGCTTGSPCDFELLIVPVFVFSCTPEALCPGIDYTGTVLLGGGANGGGSGNGGPLPDPPVYISNGAAYEGDTGAKSMSFTVSLGWTSRSPITVNYTTADGTASTGDYVPSAGVVVFQPGDTTETISIPVVGDTAKEQNENFSVNLSFAQPSAVAHIEDGTGNGRILDDDPGHQATASGRIGAGSVSASVQENGTGWIYFADGKGFRLLSWTVSSVSWNDLLGTATISGRGWSNGTYVNYTATIQHSLLGDEFEITLADGRSFGGALTSGKTTYEV